MINKPKLNVKKMEQGVRLLLEGMGADVNGDENFRLTPQRVARMYQELFTRPVFSATAFPSTYGGMVILRGHKCHGVCPHHLLPVEMRVHIGYIPGTKVLGLSKLARVVESHLTGPVLQEDLGERIADTLCTVGAKGVAVVIAAQHGCMRHRGVETDADVVTSTMRGQLLLNPAAREEFLQLITGRV